MAFKLLDAAQVEQKDRQLVLTGVDYSMKTELFDQMKSSLRKFFGEHGCNGGDCFQAVRIKEESINVVSQHPQRWRFNRGRGNSGFCSEQNCFLTSQVQMKLMVKKEEELMESVLVLVLLVGTWHHSTTVM